MIKNALKHLMNRHRWNRARRRIRGSNYGRAMVAICLTGPIWRRV